MANLEEQVLVALEAARQPLDDDELAAAVGVRRQSINQLCRRLAGSGLLDRQRVGGKIQNALVTISATPREIRPAAESPTRFAELLSEDEVKAAVRDHLQAAGYRVTVMWGRQPGVDIEAIGSEGRLLIEAKGEVALHPQQVNYFLGALGELVQRMYDPHASYGLALPDNRQYRGLVGRLPTYARERLGLVVFFVSRGREGLVVRRDG